MEFKVRKVTKANGEVDFRICLSLSADEAINAPRIADWEETNTTFHRVQGDAGQRADWVLMQARLLAYWAGIWNEKEQHLAMITRGMQTKQARTRKKRRRSR